MVYLKENKKTKVINLPRGAGKTTRLLYASESNNVPILCRLKSTKECLIDKAKRANIQIPDPITVDEFKSGNRPLNILVDDALCVLQEFVGRTTIVELTLSDEENSERVCQWNDDGSVEVKQISDLP